MNPRNLITLISLSLLISLPVAALAQSGKEKAKSLSEREVRTQETVDEATAEQREEMREKARTRRDADREVVVDDGADVEGSHDQVEDMTDAASDKMDAGRDLQVEGAKKGEGAKKSEGANKGKGAKTKGNERAQEMRARRDERKAIKEEYKSDRTAGQEAELAPSHDDDSLDADDAGEGVEDANKKPKKSWWKFWDD